MKKIIFTLFLIVSTSIISFAQKGITFYGGIDYCAMDMDEGRFTPSQYISDNYLNFPQCYLSFNKKVIGNFYIGLKYGEGHKYTFNESPNYETIFISRNIDLDLNYSVINKDFFEIILGISPTHSVGTISIYDFEIEDHLSGRNSRNGLKFNIYSKYKFKNNTFIGFNANYSQLYINKFVKLNPYSFGLFFGFNF